MRITQNVIQFTLGDVHTWCAQGDLDVGVGPGLEMRGPGSVSVK